MTFYFCEFDQLVHQASLAHLYCLHQLYLRVPYVLENEKKHQVISQNENTCFEEALLKLSSLSSINKVSTVRMIVMYSKNSTLTTDKSCDSDLTLSSFLILPFD